MNKSILIIIIAVISLGTGIMVRNSWPFREDLRQSVPEFSLPDLSGQQHTISEWRGKILIINFWASWCQPCRKEIPEFIALQAQYSNQKLQFIGVAIDELESVNQYLSSININYPMLIGADEAVVLAHKLGNISDSVPFTIIVDADGQIIHRHPGEFSKKQILEIITPLLAVGA